jgi:hypothetical protein
MRPCRTLGSSRAEAWDPPLPRGDSTTPGNNCRTCCTEEEAPRSSGPHSGTSQAPCRRSRPASCSKVLCPQHGLPPPPWPAQWPDPQVAMTAGGGAAMAPLPAPAPSGPCSSCAWSQLLLSLQGRRGTCIRGSLRSRLWNPGP